MSEFNYLFSPLKIGATVVPNRIHFAAHMTNYAVDNLISDRHLYYYRERAKGGVGLITTEEMGIHPTDHPYDKLVDVYEPEVIPGFKRLTSAIHDYDTKIFAQLNHNGMQGDGKISRLPVWGPSTGKDPIFRETCKAMELEDIQECIEYFALCARNAVEGGFDGIELHSANGYLLEQFIRPNSNQRQDDYGGPIERRARFVVEVVEAVIDAIGKDKVGIRLSPFGVFNDMPLYDDMERDYTYLAERLDECGPLYIHLVDHSSMGAPPVPDSIKETFRKVFTGTLILSGGYDAKRAESDLTAGKCDLIAVGKPFLANPDLPLRWQIGAAENAPDMETFYTPGPRGYTDYPLLPDKKR